MYELHEDERFKQDPSRISSTDFIYFANFY